MFIPCVLSRTNCRRLKCNAADQSLCRRRRILSPLRPEGARGRHLDVFFARTHGLTKIRWEDLTGLVIWISSTWILVFRRNKTPKGNNGLVSPRFMSTLTVSSEDDTIEFAIDAFPNCICEGIVIYHAPSKPLLDATGRVADSVIIEGVLWVSKDTESQ